MNGRERLTALMQGQQTDHLAWTALVDDRTLSILPETLRSRGGLDFYRYLGCDIFLLNGWGTSYFFHSPRLQWADGVSESWEQDGEYTTHTWHTRLGQLQAIFRNGHPVKYPVASKESLSIYHALWEGATYTEEDETATYIALDEEIGNDGVMTRFWGPSTIPHLLETDMGAENFYYLLDDYPAEMESLIGLIHQQELEAFRILARGPWHSVTLVENTSTYYIGPDIYRRYNMPHVSDFVDEVHRAGKIALIHMCGHIRDILPDIKETGLDGTHALTPPPLGNTPWELALDVLGEDQIIFGCLPASIFLQLPASEVGEALDQMITPRIARSRFVLSLFADGIIAPLERFMLVKEWMDNR